MLFIVVAVGRLEVYFEFLVCRFSTMLVREQGSVGLNGGFESLLHFLNFGVRAIEKMSITYVLPPLAVLLAGRDAADFALDRCTIEMQKKRRRLEESRRLQMHNVRRAACRLPSPSAVTLAAGARRLFAGAAQKDRYGCHVKPGFRRFF